MNIAYYLHSQWPWRGGRLLEMLCELPILWQSDVSDHPVFTNCQLDSSSTPWDYPLGHDSSLHTFALDWFYFYHYDVTLHFFFFFFADDCCICLWFLTTLFFLCLADIKSLMFQNHIQLKLCETEFLVSSSLKLQRWCSLSFVSGLCWPPIPLQTGIMGVIFDW